MLCCKIEIRDLVYLTKRTNRFNVSSLKRHKAVSNIKDSANKLTNA